MQGGSQYLSRINIHGESRIAKLDGDKLDEWRGKFKQDEFTPSMRLRSIRILRNALNKAVDKLSAMMKKAEPKPEQNSGEYTAESKKASGTV